MEIFKSLNYGDINSRGDQAKFIRNSQALQINDGAVLMKYHFNTNATSTLPVACAYENASCDNAAVPLFEQYITKRLNAGVMVATQWIMKDMEHFNSFEIYLNALYSPELSEECQIALWEF